MNITDIDDKIIKRAKELGEDPLALSARMTREFYKDMNMIKIKSVNLFAKASEHIPEIIDQVKILIQKGFAYQVDNDVFFNISKFPSYGNLSNQKPDELKKHRIEPDPRKRNQGDFALWKSQKSDELSWISPWGKGRPGWHIEDTAITGTYFGTRYDIHGGAVELIFPHHEAEIAQAEAAYGEHPLVNYWVHTGILRINGEKMAKSLKNFITIRDAAKKYSPEVLRFFFVSSHYRSQIDFDDENVRRAAEIVENLYGFQNRVRELLKKAKRNAGVNKRIYSVTRIHEEKFNEAMEDDFNTPMAISSLIALTRELDKLIDDKTDFRDLQTILVSLAKLGSILGILEVHKPAIGDEEEAINSLIDLILDLRQELRKKGDWTASDLIRERLKSMGIIVEDTADGTKWKKSIIT